jgi:hypothetical protein
MAWNEAPDMFSPADCSYRLAAPDAHGSTQQTARRAAARACLPAWCLRTCPALAESLLASRVLVCQRASPPPSVPTAAGRLVLGRLNDLRVRNWIGKDCGPAGTNC